MRVIGKEPDGGALWVAKMKEKKKKEEMKWKKKSDGGSQASKGEERGKFTLENSRPKHFLFVFLQSKTRDFKSHQIYFRKEWASPLICIFTTKWNMLLKEAIILISQGTIEFNPKC